MTPLYHIKRQRKYSDLRMVDTPARAYNTDILNKETQGMVNLINFYKKYPPCNSRIIEPTDL